jgi:hypothetical protein
VATAAAEAAVAAVAMRGRSCSSSNSVRTAAAVAAAVVAAAAADMAVGVAAVTTATISAIAADAGAIADADDASRQVAQRCPSFLSLVIHIYNSDLEQSTSQSTDLILPSSGLVALRCMSSERLDFSFSLQIVLILPLFSSVDFHFPSGCDAYMPQSVSSAPIDMSVVE